MIKVIEPYKGQLKDIPLHLLHTRCDNCQIPFRTAEMKFYQVGVSCWCVRCFIDLYIEMEEELF